MPRIRTVRKAEDVKDFATDKPIAVELAPEEDNSIELGSLREKETTYEVPEEHKEAVEPKKPKVEKTDDSGILALQKQIEDLKKANEENTARASEIERQRQEAVRLAEQRQTEISKLGGRAEDAEFTSITNGILAHQAEIAAAKQAYRAARAAENVEAEDEALDRMQTARVKLDRFEDAKEALEARRTAEKERPKQEPQVTVEQHIDRLAGLLPKEREWLKKHPELMTDLIKNQDLGAAHRAAEKEYSRGSDDYFKFVEERLGYRKAEPVAKVEEEDDTETPEVVVAAPVTKSAPSVSGTRTPTRVTLSPEQLEVAKASGIDPLVYAQNLLRLQKAKKDGMLQ